MEHRAGYITEERLVYIRCRNGQTARAVLTCPKSCDGNIQVNNNTPLICPLARRINHKQIISEGLKPSDLKGGICWGPTLYKCINI